MCDFVAPVLLRTGLQVGHLVRPRGVPRSTEEPFPDPTAGRPRSTATPRPDPYLQDLRRHLLCRGVFNWLSSRIASVFRVRSWSRRGVVVSVANRTDRRLRTERDSFSPYLADVYCSSSTGGRNTRGYGGCCGKAVGLDAGGHRPSADAVTGGSRASAAGEATVLGQDRRGPATSGSCCRSWGITCKGQSMVSRC